MLEKQVIIDKIEIVETGAVQVRQATKILEDGVEISKSYHRWVLMPGQNIADQEAKVQAICNAVWTPDMISAHQARMNVVQRQAA
jgi:xylose isomerase